MSKALSKQVFAAKTLMQQLNVGNGLLEIKDFTNQPWFSIAKNIADTDLTVYRIYYGATIINY